MSNIISKENFSIIINKIDPSQSGDIDFLYDLYSSLYEGIEDISKNNETFGQFNVNSLELIYYLLGEFIYSTKGLSSEQKGAFKNNEKIAETIISVSADKYLSLSLYNHHEEKLTNRYLPPISSLDLYINLMLNIVSRYDRNNPKNTLIIDMLTKSLSIARCSIKLLVDGYETEALTMWRTLHECECILILLEKYQDLAINAYLKHMEYGLVYKDALVDKERQNNLFLQIKSEMNELDLKSKDMKKYIEYGWLLAIPEAKDNKEFKLNFRDGLETLAGLHQYSQIYMTSSEILHSTPLLIYSNKKYFYYLTILNLYESFFRIEEVFRNLFFDRVGDEAKQKYLDMRKLYYSQLINIHQRELLIFRNMKKGLLRNLKGD